MDDYIFMVENKLLKEIKIKSIDPCDPIVVEHIPEKWILLGNGNYAVVVYHEDYPKYAVKIYADGRPGIDEEKVVYKSIGKHKLFSKCYHYGENYLILKRLQGITLYDCLKKGIYIPKNVIEDIDKALEYAKRKGLHPHDIHFKNVMMYKGRGIIVDISDFLHQEYCPLWDDSKKFYYTVYKKIPVTVPIPDFLLNVMRKIYRKYKKIKKKLKDLKS